MKTAIMLILVALFAAPASGEPLTRASVVAKAARENPQTAAARAKIDNARALKSEANAARWPIVTLQLGIGPSMRAKLEPGSAATSTESTFEELGTNDLSAVFGGRLEVIQPLYTFGKIDLRRSAADFGIRAETARAEITSAEVAFAAANIYESYLFTRDASRFFEEIEHTLNRSILATKDQIERGQADVSEQDLFRLQLARSAARLGLRQARTGVAQAETGLRAYLGMLPDSTIEVAEVALEPLADHQVALDDLVDTAIRRRPELVALKAGANAYEKLAAAERAGSRPDFFIRGAIDAAYTPGRDFVDSRYIVDPLGHLVPSLIVGLNWTFQGSTSGARGEGRMAEAAYLTNLRSWAEAALPAEVRVAMLDVNRARSDIDESREALTAAKKWLVQASADYAAGLGDSTSLTDSVEAYATMRIANLDAIRRLNVGLAALAKATGSLIGDESALYPGKEQR